MGDLFDGYGSTLTPRKTASGVPAFDEMFAAPASSGSTAQSRPAYRELYQALAKMTQEELRGRTESLASSYLAQGVTFDFAGEERPFPLDAVPRVIEYDEWSRIEKGVQQRVRALEAFLDDAYGHQHCVRDGVLPAALIASSQYFYRQAAGIHSANGVRIQVAGIDLIRDEHGEMRVLEDNVRVPSGVSYVISNRRVMAQTLPELFVSMRVHPVGDYPNKLLQALRASAPPGIDDPNVVVLTPGVYNSAYFEHTLLARLMGVELVEGRDLQCMGGKVFMRTTRGPKRVDVIYRRVDDDFLDPLQFRADSMLGAPGLMLAARLGNVTIANAVGNGVADDKLLYTYVPRWGTTRTSCCRRCGRRHRPASTTRTSWCSRPVSTIPRTSSTRCWRASWASSSSRGATCSAWAARCSCAPPAAPSASTSSTAGSTTTSWTRCSSAPTPCSAPPA